MALQDKFDSIFTNAVLRNTLIGGIVSNDARNVAQNDNASVAPANIVKMSNSLTSLQNAFNKIYTHSLNVRNLHRYDEKRLLNIKKESNLESRITRPPNIPIQAAGAGSSDTTVRLMDDLTSSVENLTKKLEQSNSASPGGGGALSSAAGTAGGLAAGMSKFGRKLLGPLGVALDVGSRAQEGQAVGQIAAGVGGGIAGGIAGAKGGAFAGGAIGALFGGVGAAPGAVIGGAIGGLGGYLGGSALGDTAYEQFERRAVGGPVRMGGTYVVGERGPEVITLTGSSGRVTASGRRGQVSNAERVLTQAAKKSADARRRVEEEKTIGPTSYSSKLSGYLSTLYRNMPTWLDRIKDWLGLDAGANTGANMTYNSLGPGQYTGVGDLSGAEGDWKNDTEFLAAIDEVAHKHDIDANDLLGLIRHESGRTFSPTVRGKGSATGLFQFTSGGGFNTNEISRMSRAEQVRLADEKLFTGMGLPRGANAGQLYAAVFLPGRARNAGWEGTLARRGEAFYDQNPSLDADGNDIIDFSDLASVISRNRVAMRLGPSPSLVGATSTAGFISPVTGRIGSGFGPRNGRAHEGSDFPVPAGTPVRAAKAGTIISAGLVDGYGNLLIIDHGGGVTTRYGHLRSFRKTTGRVDAGEIVALSGGVPGEPGAGRTTGAHLHFEVRVNDRPVNPRLYLTSFPANATLEPRTAAGLSAGYRREVRNIGGTQVPVIVLPSGGYFGASANSVEQISGFRDLNQITKSEILAYFSLRA